MDGQKVTFGVSVHDDGKTPFIVECVTEGDSVTFNGGPYYRLKLGDLTIFLDPPRLWQLGLEISRAKLPEQIDSSDSHEQFVHGSSERH